MKIAFLTTSRYPTEKAYGVTIQYSCRASINLGHTAEILTITEVESDAIGNKITSFVDNNLLKYFSRKLLDSGRIAFVLRSFLLAPSFLYKQRKEKYDLLWIRDLYFAAAIRIIRIRIPIVLEIHHVPKGFSLKVLIWLSQRNTLIATLTSRHLKLLAERDVKGPICVSPMGVPDDFFLEPSMKPKNERMNIGYVGKSSSSGNDNNLELLLLEFLSAKSILPNLKLFLIGLEHDAGIKLKLEIPRTILNAKEVTIIGNIPHPNIKSYLETMDCGIVPYLNSSYNLMRFPIKILEYAASSTHIIVSDTPAHRSILNDSLATFYNPELQGSLERAIVHVCKNSSETKIKTINAFDWAKHFTYENRVQNVLERVSSENMS